MCHCEALTISVSQAGSPLGAHVEVFTRLLGMHQQECCSSGHDVRCCAFCRSMAKLATMDIFAGCGGLSCGLHKAGAAETKWSIEYEQPAAEAFKYDICLSQPRAPPASAVTPLSHISQHCICLVCLFDSQSLCQCAAHVMLQQAVCRQGIFLPPSVPAM